MAITFTTYMNAMWLFFHTALGLNDYAVAGLMGNFYAESGCTSTALHDDRSQVTSQQFITNINNGTWTRNQVVNAGRYAFGLAQWRGNRIGTLWDMWENNKAEYNNDIGNQQLHLDHVKYELTEGNYQDVYADLLNATSYQQACSIVQDDYEVSGASTAERQSYTAEIYNHYVQAGQYTITIYQAQIDGATGDFYKFYKFSLCGSSKRFTPYLCCSIVRTTQRILYACIIWI